MLHCNLAMYHLVVCQKSHSKLKIPIWPHWLSNNMPVYSPIMPALCSMLLVTYYASNYAGIIGLGLLVTCSNSSLWGYKPFFSARGENTSYNTGVQLQVITELHYVQNKILRNSTLKYNEARYNSVS